MFKILNKDKLLSKFHYATTDVFLKEFEKYIYDRIEYKTGTQLIKNLTNLIDKDKIIDCKKFSKNMNLIFFIGILYCSHHID